MRQNEILVLELRPRWTPELQRQFVGEVVSIRGCRQPADLLEKLGSQDRRDTQIVVLDMSSAAEGCFDYLFRRMRDSRKAPAIVIGSDQTAELEWVVRDMGATAYLSEFVLGETLAQVCRRQWRIDRREKPQSRQQTTRKSIID